VGSGEVGAHSRGKALAVGLEGFPGVAAPAAAASSTWFDAGLQLRLPMVNYEPTYYY